MITLKNILYPIKNLKLEPESGLQISSILETESELEIEPKYTKYLNEIVNEERNINEEMFRNYFKHQSASFLVKYLFQTD